MGLRVCQRLLFSALQCLFSTSFFLFNSARSQNLNSAYGFVGVSELYKNQNQNQDPEMDSLQTTESTQTNSYLSYHRPSLSSGFQRGNGPSSDTTKCYSCMSEIYHMQWQYLDHTYREPKNFTRRCDNTAKEHLLNGVALVDCPSVCISMTEKLIIGGYEIDGHIRGCFDTMLVNGFNETAVFAYRWLKRDNCRWYNRKQILKLPVRTEGEIFICYCYGDSCNHGLRPSAGIGSSRVKAALVFIVPLTLTALTNLYLSGVL